MRASAFTGLLVAVTVAAATGLGVVGRADPARGQDDVAPTPVPGPMRPIVATPPTPIPAPITERRKARPPSQVTAAVDPAATPLPPSSVLEGVFRPGATGEKAEGRVIVRLTANELRLEDLAVTPGRDLELWLVAVDRLGDGADLTDTKRVSLGRLKKAQGNQAYRLPPEIDLRVYRMVVVWSRRERAARAGALLVAQAAARPAKPKAGRIH